MIDRTTCGVVVGVLLCAGSAQGGLQFLTPGGAEGLAGTTAIADPVVTGVVPAPDIVIPFTIEAADTSLLFEAEFVSRVVRSEETGNMLFSYAIRETGDVLNGLIASVSVTDYVGWMTEVEFRTDAVGDQGPSRATRSPVIGDALTFEFGFTPPIGGGTDSLPFFALTNAPHYNTKGTVVIELTTGEFITLADIYAPVPSPGVGAVAGIAGLMMVRRKRHDAGARLRDH